MFDMVPTLLLSGDNNATFPCLIIHDQLMKNYKELTCYDREGIMVI